MNSVQVVVKEEEEQEEGLLEGSSASASVLFTGKPFNLADQEEGGGSAAMQGKESPVGSNTQETHQYVGPYRLEKTLGKGQTGGCIVSCLSHFRYPALVCRAAIDVDGVHAGMSNCVRSECLIKSRVRGSSCFTRDVITESPLPKLLFLLLGTGTMKFRERRLEFPQKDEENFADYQRRLCTRKGKI